MTTQERCEAILRKMIELANEGTGVAIDADMGDWTATVWKISQEGREHTHIGSPGFDGSFEDTIENLYNVLHGGPGLSWHFEPADEDEQEPADSDQKTFNFD